MEERKRCVRCGRAIDEWAGICPFCNWNQADPPPVEESAPEAVAEYRPPSEFNIKKKLMYAGIGVVVLMIAFTIGVVINREDAPERAPAPLAEQAAEHNVENVTKPLRADTPLVPVTGGIEQPITSAPAAVPQDGMASGYDRTDATAVSAAEYAQIARRAQAEQQQRAALQDPLAITGPAYAQGGTQPRGASPTASQKKKTTPPRQAAGTGSVRTRPVPRHQPVPRMSARGTARLTILVGADGRVRSVDIERPLRGNNAELLAAVRNWRFKPATENGRPVTAPYTVDISYDQ